MRLPGDFVGDVGDRARLVLVEQSAEGGGTGAKRGRKANGLGCVRAPGVDVQLRVGGFERSDATAQRALEDGEGRQLWSVLEVDWGSVVAAHGATGEVNLWWAATPCTTVA